MGPSERNSRTFNAGVEEVRQVATDALQSLGARVEQSEGGNRISGKTGWSPRPTRSFVNWPSRVPGGWRSRRGVADTRGHGDPLRADGRPRSVGGCVSGAGLMSGVERRAGGGGRRSGCSTLEVMSPTLRLDNRQIAHRDV